MKNQVITKRVKDLEKLVKETVDQNIKLEIEIKVGCILLNSIKWNDDNSYNNTQPSVLSICVCIIIAPSTQASRFRGLSPPFYIVNIHFALC